VISARIRWSTPASLSAADFHDAMNATFSPWRLAGHTAERKGDQMTRPTPVDYEWMKVAIGLAYQCPPSPGAFSVGAVIVDQNGEEISRGYSRETDSHVHAEESALAKLASEDPRLTTATIYSTLEPCSQRKSRPRTCTQLILAAGIPRVVIAWREPGLFVMDCQGYELLVDAGVAVVEILDLAQEAQAPNTHLW
jgi:diaminohydroxyphosphoribosylaminopyrimidine deaminase / 5-amino-6-(5-phosphoribosylamino)uracil reductase